MNKILKSAITASLVTLAACNASGGSTSGFPAAKTSVSKPAPMATSTCMPAPLPTPQVALIDPAAHAIGVPRKIVRIRFEIANGSTTATRVLLKPSSGRPLDAHHIMPIGALGPDGQVFGATVPGLLAAKTKYSVFVSGVQTFGGCGESYKSPAGSFKTGTKRR